MLSAQLELSIVMSRQREDFVRWQLVFNQVFISLSVPQLQITDAKGPVRVKLNFPQLGIRQPLDGRSLSFRILSMDSSVLYLDGVPPIDRRARTPNCKLPLPFSHSNKFSSLKIDRKLKSTEIKRDYFSKNNIFML